MRAQILRHQRHRRAVAAMAGDHDELPDAGARHALAERHPGLQRHLRRQRQRARIVDMLGRNPDRLKRKERRGNVVGQQLAHPRQIGLRDHDVGADRQMRAVLFGGRQRQHRDPARRLGGADLGPVDLGPVAGRKRGSHRAQVFLCGDLQASLYWLGGRNALRPQSPIMGQNDRRSPIMNPALLPRALTLSLVALVIATFARGRPDHAGQGLVRDQLAGRGRAWRLLPGGGRRHLQEVRARRHHRAGRPEREQPDAADRRQDRLLHGRQHA